MKANEDTEDILVIGAGPAGLEVSSTLSGLGYRTVIVEKEDETGGHLRKWDRLFPTGESAPALLENKRMKAENDPLIRIIRSAEAENITGKEGRFTAHLSTGEDIKAKAVVLTTGFRLFDARRKEEYGYGIYDRVITNSDLEEHFRKGEQAVAGTPERIGFVHCVGSRDEKAGNRHCSKVCCATAVKQAMELAEKYPQAQIYCFYMDLRMFGRHFEDMYLEAQQKYGIRFIRGRVSEVSEDSSARLVVKAEDTLAGKPVRITLDLLVLMAGMVPHTSGTPSPETIAGTDTDGFILQQDPAGRPGICSMPGIFAAGACTGPKTLPETISEARSAAFEAAGYIKSIQR